MKIAKLIYTIVWSLGLFFGTFWINLRAQSGLNFFNLSNNTILEATKSYIFPMIMVVLLFMWDTIYSSFMARSYNQKPSIEIILICMCFILGGFLGTFMSESAAWAFCGFCVTWLALTIMKLHCVFVLSVDDDIQHASTPDENNF